MNGERILQFWLLCAAFGTVGMDALSVKSAQGAPRRGVSDASVVKRFDPKEYLSIPTHIRVRLAEAEARVVVRGLDLVLKEELRGGAGVRAEHKSEWEIHCQEGRVRTKPRELANGHLGEVDFKEPLVIQSPSGFFHFQNKPYRDELRIYSNGSFCEVVNTVEIEKYLDGLVNAEFSSRWNAEAIAAQVVAARTYAFYQLLQSRQSEDEEKRHYDLDDNIWDQVYDGSVREDFRSSQAVQRSKGLILTVKEGKFIRPIKAFYHSTCGGVTELPENVWGKPYPGFKRAVKCRFCNKSPLYQWVEGYDSKEIAQKFLNGVRTEGEPPGWPKAALSLLRKGKMISFWEKKRDSQGRLLALDTTWTDGKTTAVIPLSGARLRNWLGINRIKSLSFWVSKTGSYFTFRGKGFGHGVGLCQWGAKAMGEKGYKMADILKAYYPDAVLRKLW